MHPPLTRGDHEVQPHRPPPHDERETERGHRGDGQHHGVTAVRRQPKFSSRSLSWSTRRWWRPPSKSVSSHSRRISSARPDATMRPPIESTLASLCCRDSRAVYRSLQSAARAPFTLLAASCSPCPLPPSTMPRSASPATTVRATAAQIGG